MALFCVSCGPTAATVTLASLTNRFRGRQFPRKPIESAVLTRPARHFGRGYFLSVPRWFATGQVSDRLRLWLKRRLWFLLSPGLTHHPGPASPPTYNRSL